MRIRLSKIALLLFPYRDNLRHLITNKPSVDYHHVPVNTMMAFSLFWLFLSGFRLMNKNNGFALWHWNPIIMPDEAYWRRTTLFSFTLYFVRKWLQLHKRRIRFQGLHFASHIICHCAWPVASLRNFSGFSHGLKGIRLIAYQPVNNEEERQCRRERDGQSAGPGSLEAKTMHFYRTFLRP